MLKGRANRDSVSPPNYNMSLNRIGTIALALLLTAPLVAQTPAYDVYAIRYATLKDFSVAGLVAGADKSRKMDIAMMVILIKGGGRNILFDCGFYREQFMRQWHPADYEKPSVAIARAGLKPEDITDVIISHIHWDHADGFDLSPKSAASGSRRTSWSITRAKPGKAIAVLRRTRTISSAW